MSGSPETSKSPVGFWLWWIFCGMWVAIDDLIESFVVGKSGH